MYLWSCEHGISARNGEYHLNNYIFVHVHMQGKKIQQSHDQ